MPTGKITMPLLRENNLLRHTCIYGAYTGTCATINAFGSINDIYVVALRNAVGGAFVYANATADTVVVDDIHHAESLLVKFFAVYNKFRGFANP
jgi:hypothetical protein